MSEATDTRAKRRALLGRRELMKLALPGLGALAGACRSRAKQPRSAHALIEQTEGQSIALASYAARVFGFMPFINGVVILRGVEFDAEDEASLSPYLTRLLHHAESSLAQSWRVRPSATFVASEDYQRLQTLPPIHVAPRVEGYPLRTFGDSEVSRSAPVEEYNERYRGQPSPERVTALAALTQTDLLAFVELLWPLNAEVRASVWIFDRHAEPRYVHEAPRVSISGWTLNEGQVELREHVDRWVRESERELAGQLELGSYPLPGPPPRRAWGPVTAGG